MPAFLTPVPAPIHPTSWQRPSGNVEFKLTQRFGCTGVPEERPYGSCAHFHRANDLANGRAGDPVRTVAAGRVVYAGTDPLSGSISIVVNHGGGLWTGYAHLLDRSVSKGAWLQAGQHIGHVGATGHATGPHLHFAVKTAMPALYLSAFQAFWGDVRGRWADPWALIPHL